MIDWDRDTVFACSVHTQTKVSHHSDRDWPGPTPKHWHEAGTKLFYIPLPDFFVIMVTLVQWLSGKMTYFSWRRTGFESVHSQCALIFFGAIK